MTESSSTYSSHPCFGSAARKTVDRIHLPVAPRANSRIKYSSMQIMQEAIQPEAALAWLDDVIAEGRKIDVVGITGPGDPLVLPDLTFRTLELVKAKYPSMSLCVTTLGIGAANHAETLAKIGVSHVTLLVDAVSRSVIEELYAWIRPSKKNVPLEDASSILLSEQSAAVKALKAAGITVKINTTVYPSNADHVGEIAETMKALGADIMAIIPFIPKDDEQEILLKKTDSITMAAARDLAARHMELMPEWEECGAAVKTETTSLLPKPTKSRPNVAAVSSNGMEVDMHLGHAEKILIYGPRDDGLACLLETRTAPKAGGGTARWEELAGTLSDCFIILAASAGDSPKQILSRHGLYVAVTDGEIEGTVDSLYGGGKKKKCKK
ncbi:NifB/NifX family molybdenum-iron cluster-binding protein [Desulfovibrio gilichinskyi]|uniref:Nitrogen fixation protein NifB n=1 Tax=Desulfovibrio gilichinskyi TaxID=1519643 RepID=A0A1X7CIG8_9BACT|nr:NifB/NifX family molybdenum-iron cluster-binding protein [Desulfovibrio gilichinskyi]SME97272.1 nitrogen fixation protein NifB [Desulfovibrio gilichinskyi]